jgi:hypothetical protein
MKDLRQKAQKMCHNFRYQNDLRPWHTPPELADNDLLIVEGMHNPAWDRNEINQVYSSNVLAGGGKKGGTTGDLIAMKWQADFLAVEERAWRMRHMSLVRGAAMMHSRLDGHSNDNAGMFKKLEDVIQRYIDAGKAYDAP